MGNSLISNIKDLLGISADTALGDLAPIIGNALQSIKIRKLGKRLNSCEEKIEIISTKLSVIDDEKFVTLLKEFLFPSILQHLLDEEEDRKTSYFLNGFEFVIDNKLINESKILIFYDILRELRVVEIEYLSTLSLAYKQYRKKLRESGERVENPFDNEEFSTMKHTIEVKLEGLGLIKTSRSDSAKDSFNLMVKKLNTPPYLGSRTVIKDEVYITNFGNEFLKMFYILDKYK